MLQTIQELRESRAGLLHQMRGILALAKKEDRSLTEDERKQYDGIEKETEALGQQIADREADQKREARAEALAKNLAESRGRQTPATVAAVVSAETVPAEPKTPAFRSLGEQLQAIAHAGMHGDHPGSRDQRLSWQSLAPATGAAQAVVPSDGGYLIQKDFSTELLKRMNELGSIKSRVRTIPIGPDSDGLKLPAVDETSRATGSRWGGVQCYWGAENDAATAKKPKFRMMELELKDLIGLAYVSNRLLRDASAVESIFQQAFSEEMNFMIEDALVNGTGAGMPLGVLNSPAIVSVAKETGQAAATIVFENVQKMWSRLWARCRPNAVWIVNQDCEPALNSMTLAVGTGGVPVYLPPGGLSQSPYATLMGRPVLPVEYCATLGTTGDIMCVDFSQMIAIEKDQMQADSSLHVRFTTNENTFRFIYRYDAQPAWHSALTPFKGSATKSFAVKLDTRS